jgi:hypothetical protein
MTVDNKNLKLLPFDIAKAGTGHPCVTRTGAKANLIFLNPAPNEIYKLWWAIEYEIGSEFFTTDMLGRDRCLNNCIFLVPSTKTMWMAYDPKKGEDGKYLCSSDLRYSEKDLLNVWGNEIKNKGWKITTVEVEV